MGNLLGLRTESRVDNRSAPRERVNSGVQYEGWLAAGFAQAAYVARDLGANGFVHPDTLRRVRNERKGLAIEKLGEPYITVFDYSLNKGMLQAEDGEDYLGIMTRGYEKALEDARVNPQLDFLAKRYAADVSHAEFLQEFASNPTVPVGATVIINSPSPDAHELGVPATLLNDYNYRSNEQMAVQWIATKTIAGIKLQTSNLFHAAPEYLAEATSFVSRQPVEVLAREDMPWARTIFVPAFGTDVASELQVAYDGISLRETGRQTFHGLESHEHNGSDVTGLVDTPEFEQALDASDFIIEQVSRSLLSGKFTVDGQYMQRILAMKRADGDLELTGSDRDSVLRVLNVTEPARADLIAALRVAHQAADASLWATLRCLTDGDSIEILGNSRDAAYMGVSSVEAHRQQGSQEYGCPGDGPGQTKQKSIFDMSAEQLAGAFMRKTFITNCPLCEEKGVTATQENGTITCGECKGCVDVCTGEILHKSRKQAKTREPVGKLATRTVGVVDWMFDQWEASNRKRKLELQKKRKTEVEVSASAKYEKMAA